MGSVGGTKNSAGKTGRAPPPIAEPASRNPPGGHTCLGGVGTIRPFRKNKSGKGFPPRRSAPALSNPPPSGTGTYRGRPTSMPQTPILTKKKRKPPFRPHRWVWGRPSFSAKGPPPTLPPGPKTPPPPNPNQPGGWPPAPAPPSAGVSTPWTVGKPTPEPKNFLFSKPPPPPAGFVGRGGFFFPGCANLLGTLPWPRWGGGLERPRPRLMWSPPKISL